jgi:transitional endoplasmic reticulum ATPase
VPDAAGRARILSIQTEKMPLASDVNLDAVARRTERYTGADLEDVVRRAGLIALRESLGASAVTMAHFEAALADSRATVTAEMEQDYAAMAGRLKQQASAIQPIGFIAPGMLQGRGPKGDG